MNTKYRIENYGNCYFELFLVLLMLILITTVFYYLIKYLTFCPDEQSTEMLNKTMTSIAEKIPVTEQNKNGIQPIKSMETTLITRGAPGLEGIPFKGPIKSMETELITRGQGCVNDYGVPINYNGSPDTILYVDPIQRYDILKLTDPFTDPRGRSSADEIPTPIIAGQLNYPTQGIVDRYHRVGLLVKIRRESRRNNYDKVNHVFSNSSNDNSSYTGISVDSLYSGRDNGLNPYKKTKANTNTKNKTKRLRKKSKYFTKYESFENLSDEDDEDYDETEEMYENVNSVNSVENFSSSNNLDNSNDIMELMGKKITNNWYKYFTSMSVGNKIIKIVVNNRNRRELYDGDIVFIPELGQYKVSIDEMDMIEYNPYYF